MLLAVFGIGTVLMLISLVLIIRALQAVPQNLGYEAVHTFYVAGNQVTIETQSYSVANGDNGPAKVIVSADGIQTTIDSRFDEDRYMDAPRLHVLAEC